MLFPQLFVSKTDGLHQLLRFPRLEFVVGGLLIVALTFYSGLALGSGDAAGWQDSRAAAVLVLLLLTAPYALFLWWLSLGRALVPYGGAAAADSSPVRPDCLPVSSLRVAFPTPVCPAPPI